MSKPIFAILAAVGVLASACTSASRTGESIDSPLGLDSGFPVPADPPAARYVIDAAVDLQTGEVRGHETIGFRNGSGRPIPTIAVEAAALSPGRSLRLSVGGRPLQTIGDQPEQAVVYELPEPVKPGAELSIEAEFSLELGPGRDVIQLLGWHPRLWWDGLPTRDSCKVKLEIPAGYAAAVSGRLNEGTGYYENDGVTTRFGVYLAKDMSTAQMESAGVLITALFTPEREQCARFCLGKAAEIIAFYTDWLGFYPAKSLCIIPGASRPMGGYPFASGIVVVHGQENFEAMPPLHWEWITAHEVGHQYWGEHVMSDDPPYVYVNSWLLIAMGIWTDRGYVLDKGLGYEKHQAFLNRYLAGVRQRLDTTADAPASLQKRQNFDRNNVIIHGKGFSILSALACTLGDETFERVFRRCLREFGGRRFGYRDLWRIGEEESGQSLDWFFDQWVRSPKYLCYQVTSRESVPEGGGYLSRIEIEAAPDSIRMPVPIEALFADGSRQFRATDRYSKVNRLEFKSSAELKEVVLDPEHRLAMIDSPLPVLPEELPETISRLPWEGAGKDALAVFVTARDARMDIPDLWFILGLKLIDGKFYDEAAQSFAKSLELRPGDFNVLVWLGHMKDLTGDRTGALAYYEQALKANPQGSGQRHDQWGIVLDRKWVEDRLSVPFEFGKK